MSAAVLAAAAAMAMPMPGGGGAAVDIPGRYFAPADLDVLVGQTVTWTNDDAAAHSVVAEDDSFRTAPLARGAGFSVTFTEPGDHPYYCAVHRNMRGTIHVSTLGLTGPTEPVRAGDMAMLDVLAPAGTPAVTLERLTAGGSEVVDQVAPGPDGRATFHLQAAAPGRYRARAGAVTSAVVAVGVRPAVEVVAGRRGRTVSVRATIAPAQPGASVALKQYVRERFDYVPVRTRRSADGASVAFTLKTTRRLALRVGVLKAPGGWSPGDSRTVVVPSLKG